jgi:hypothetical protein
MVSERAKRFVNVLTRFSSHFTRNRDAASVTLIGGAITFIVSLVIFYFTLTSGTVTLLNNFSYDVLEVIFPGFIEILIAWIMIRREDLSKILGGLAILFGLVSLPGSDGGLFIGFILVFIGGFMSVLYKPMRKTSTVL